MRTFNIIDYMMGVIVSFIGYCVGGYDGMATTVLSLTVIDFIVGICVALYQGKFSPKEMAKGILKKIMIYSSIAVAVILEKYLGIPVRSVFIVFYIVYEGSSIFENLGKVIKYPPKIKDVFASLKGE